MQRNPSFSPEEEVEIQVILEEMLHKQIIRETTHEPTEFVSPIFIVKKAWWWDKTKFELERVEWVCQIWTF